MLIGSVIFMFSLSWRLSMVTLIAIPLIFLISKVYGVYYDVRFLQNIFAVVGIIERFYSIGKPQLETSLRICRNIHPSTISGIIWIHVQSIK